MSKRVLVVALLSLCLGGIYLLTSLPRVPSSAVDGEVVAEDRREPAVRPVEAFRPNEPSDRVELSTPDATSFLLAVRDRESHAPIADAEVVLEGTRSIRTDRDGQCRLDWQDDRVVQISVTAAGFVPRRLAMARVTTSGTVCVWLQRGVSRWITVTDADSRAPLPGVAVFAREHHVVRQSSRAIRPSGVPGFWLSKPIAVSDSRGRVAITALAESHATLVFCKLGYAVHVLERLATADVDLAVEMVAAAATEVRVVDGIGEPLGARAVSMRLDDVSLMARSDDDGVCRFPSGRDGTDGAFTAIPDETRSPSFAWLGQLVQRVEERVGFPASAPVDPRYARDELGALVVRWTPRPGTVTLATRLEANPSIARSAHVIAGVADVVVADGSSGQATLRRVGDVEDVVALADDGLLRADCRGLDHVELALARPATSALSVVVGEAVGECRVEIHPSDPLLVALVRPVGSPLASATTEAGVARFEGLTAGEYTLRVRSAGFAPQTVHVEGRSRIDLHRVEQADIAGVVVGCADRPLVLVREPGSGFVAGSVLADVDGSFLFEQLSCGDYDIEARQWVGGVPSGAVDPARVLGGTLPERVRLPRGGLSGVELVWPTRTGPLRVTLRGKRLVERADVVLYRVHPYDTTGSTFECLRKHLHPEGSVVFPGVDRTKTWLAVIEGESGRIYALDLVPAGADDVRMSVSPTLERIEWEGDGPCSLVPQVGGEVARDVVFVAEQSEGRWLWRDVPVGSYLLVPLRVEGFLRGGTSRRRTVEIGPATERLR